MLKSSFNKKIQRFYRHSRQGLYTYALSLTRDEAAAEDAIQIAILHILEREKKPADLKPYVFRCVRNAVFSQTRKKSNEYSFFLDPNFRNDATDTHLNDLRHLDSCLKHLSADEHETIVLKIYGGFTFKEMAELRETSLNTVASWYRRGLNKLKDMLEEPRHGRH